MKKETIKYFEGKDPKLPKFYLLPKIRKQLNIVPSRPVTSVFMIRKTYTLLDFHLQPLAQATESYIEDTNNF